MKMYGVVLWSDKEDRKAVIWCEDHGDLAFYCGRGENMFDGPEDAPELDTGDFVQFKLNENRNIRIATTPKVVAESQFHDLARSLKTSLPEVRQRIRPQVPCGSNVIAFEPRREAARLAG